ncbi:hypothetical protein KEM56_007520 [Ascosphaera pollenicola]|nr:hypothetical protein KEM56_007520 [Ascosphaera pollenicola]
MSSYSGATGTGDEGYTSTMKQLIQGAIPSMIVRILRKMEESGELEQYAMRAQIHAAGRTSGGENLDNGSSTNSAPRDSEVPDPGDVLKYYKTIDHLPIPEECLEDLNDMCTDILNDIRPGSGLRIESSALEFFTHTMEIELAKIFEVADRYRVHAGRSEILPLHIALALEQLEYKSS